MVASMQLRAESADKVLAEVTRIVRDIAAAHGAQVTIGERSGGGAVFSVRFPA